MAYTNGGREMTRAERFEEEKRRIVDSCFNKKDTDGSCKHPCPPPSAWRTAAAHLARGGRPLAGGHAE